MENIYSKFYTGRKNPFGIGTWDSDNKIRRKLNHSNSQPYFISQNSSDSKNLILPQISSKYENGAKKPKKYETQTSSISSTYNYDTKKNRKELSNYIRDINNSVANKLQSDNYIAQKKLNNLKNNYNEIKTLLNNKIEKLEHDQQMQFDNLKYALEQGGGLKMMGAVKNANGGNQYDLQRAEEEDIIDVTRRLPKLLDEQLSKTYNTKKKYGTGRLFSKMPDIRKRVDDELNRQKALDDLKFKRELDEIEAKRENIRQERNRMLRELQNQDIDDLDDPIYLSPSPPFPPPPMYNPYNPYMMPSPFNPYFMPPMNNNNNDSTGELIKIFLIKKLFEDNKPQSSDKNTYPPYFYPFYPGMPMPYANNNGQPLINYPQPLIVQPPPYVPYQNPYGRKNKGDESESQKGIPFIDPLEKYLDMVNKAKETSNDGDEGEDNGGNNKKGDDGEGGEDEGEGEGEGEGGGEEDGEGGEGEGERGGEGEGGGEEGGEGGGGGEEGGGKQEDAPEGEGEGEEIKGGEEDEVK